MKKQLLAIALLASGLSKAQTWSEDFNSVTPTNLPTSWLQNNVDGFTVNSALATYSFGTKAWVTRDFSTSTDPIMAAHGKIAASTSYYSTAKTSNDWLITPSFSVPANGVIEWDAQSPDASYPDGYLVKVSTTGTLTTDFTTTLLNVSAENSDVWTTRGLSLNAYAGQTIRIAFVNNSYDMFLLWLDNIKVLIPSSSDGSVIDITGLTRYSTTTSQNITGTFVSKGYTAANNATLNYKINNSAVHTETITFTSALNYNGTTNYSFVTPATLALGKNDIKVWVSEVNGVGETVFTNDTAKSTVFVASQSKTRNALVEEFSSSTCGPCASLNASFDPMLNSNNPNTGGQVNVIKNQVNWPSPGTDPSYNPHSAARVTFYDVSAAPTTLINGHEMTSEDQSGVDDGKLEPAYATINASLTISNGVVSGMSSITPYVTVAATGQLVVHQVLAQKSYTFAGTTSQRNFYHVMRKMFPDANGTAVTTVDGSAMSANLTHTITSVNTPTQGSYNFWNTTNVVYEYVVFLQDAMSYDILQSGSAQVAAPVGIVELKDNQQIGIYPNPANDYAIVGVKLNESSKLDITIYDVTGKVVFSLNDSIVDAGQQEMKINTSNFTSGTYNVVVKTNKGTLTDKLIVVK